MIIKIPAYKCDKELFPGAQLSPDEDRAETLFYQDFKIAEKFGGIRAVMDTFKRAFGEWKDNIKYLTEIAVVTNHLGWENYDKNTTLSTYYFQCYHKVCDLVYQADEEGNNIGPFTDADVVFFHNVLD